MKKSVILTLAALAALMAASCQKEETGRTLTATIEQYEHNSKAYIDNENYACWINGDLVKINGTTERSITIGATGHSDQATIDVSGITGDITAFYPASRIEGTTVTFPHVQEYDVDDQGRQLIDNPMAAYCPNGSYELRFRNLCALLKVTIVGNTSVKAIQVKGIDNQMLWGKAQLMLNNQNQLMLTDFTNGSNSVTLEFSPAVTINDSKSFYIVVPAASNFNQLTIAVLTTNGAHSKTSSIGQSLSRNQIGAISYTPNGIEEDTFTPDWMIRYTASDQVTPNPTSDFGDANYLSANSSFSNNSGYLLFDEPLTEISDGCFENCFSLESITLPASLTSIADRAFADCTDLKSITLPASLTSIAYGAFFGCYELASISLPASLTSIGGEAFSGCDCLVRVDCHRETPPQLTGSDVFGIPTAYAVLHVPSGHRSDYSGWSSYFQGGIVENL